MATYIGTNENGKLIYEIEPEEVKTLFSNEPNTAQINTELAKLAGKIKTKTVTATTTTSGAINIGLNRTTNPVLNIIITSDSGAGYYPVLAATSAGAQYAVIKRANDNANVSQISVSVLVIYMEDGE